MGDTVLASWLRGTWGWWRSLGQQLHEDIFTLSVFLIAGSVLPFSDRWAGLLAWVWIGLGTSKEQLLTILTGVLAVATYGLFRRTADLAQRTADAGLLADMHHQQSLSGLIVMQRAVVIFASRESGGQLMPILQLRGDLRNVGFGPALDVVVHLHHKSTGNGSRSRFGALYQDQAVDLNKMTTNAPIVLSTEPVGDREAADFGTLVDASIKWSNVFGGRQEAHYLITSSYMRLMQVSPLKIVSRRLPTTHVPRDMEPGEDDHESS